MRGQSGHIISPRYPSNYPDNVDCTWTIIANRGARITITFADFEVILYRDQLYSFDYKPCTYLPFGSLDRLINRDITRVF